MLDLENQKALVATPKKSKSMADPDRYPSVDLDFGRALAGCLEQIGPGQVATCGALARALGDVRAARAVATWLVEHPDVRGTHRVVRADGRPLLVSTTRNLRADGVALVRGRVSASRLVAALEPVSFLTALREQQRALSERVVERGTPGPIGRIAGVDAAYAGNVMTVAAVSLDAKDLAPLEIVTLRRETRFPYIPGYLAYRESPGIEAALLRLQHRPDMLLVDGHGRLHPALFGIACYVGLRLDLPTIGVAKHPLVGRVRTAKPERDAPSPIDFRGLVRGYAWTPPGRARPIFVSVGHRTSLDRAIDVVRRSTRDGYPEPLKLADRVCREMKGNEKREKGATQ